MKISIGLLLTFAHFSVTAEEHVRSSSCIACKRPFRSSTSGTTANYYPYHDLEDGHDARVIILFNIWFYFIEKNIFMLLDLLCYNISIDSFYFVLFFLSFFCITFQLFAYLLQHY